MCSKIIVTPYILIQQYNKNIHMASGDTMEKTNKHSSIDLSFIGLILGTYIGYVLRPVANGYGTYGQLSLEMIYLNVFYGAGYIHSIATRSMHYMLAGALIGLFLGWILDKNIHQDNMTNHKPRPAIQSHHVFKNEIPTPSHNDKTIHFGSITAVLGFLFIAILGTFIGGYIAGPEHFAYGLIGGALASTMAGIIILSELEAKKNT